MCNIRCSVMFFLNLMKLRCVSGMKYCMYICVYALRIVGGKVNDARVFLFLEGSRKGNVFLNN